jgi:hypothetical protein
METREITAAVPIIMAKAVRIERRRLALIASRADIKDSSANIK